MADIPSGDRAPDASARPKGLDRPIRKRVKKLGKRLTRRLAAYQARQSLVPDAPFLEAERFAFLAPLQRHWPEIEAEARDLLKHREHIPGFQEVSPDQYRIATESNWRTLFLFGFGERIEGNCRMMPRTAELIERAGSVHTAWVSILTPGYRIPPHTGVTKGILRAHLGLLIPEDRENCWIRVGDERRSYAPGSLFVIDDTYEHEVHNDTDEDRVVLLLDFDRPMRFGGRMLTALFLRIMKLTAFYQEPKRNIRDHEARLAAAAERANETLESMSDR
ncbi:MAG: aspartyl/asparaginyl beta-hydroxylase domain-containing protein [Paracoccaceae bacterium]